MKKLLLTMLAVAVSLVTVSVIPASASQLAAANVAFRVCSGLNGAGTCTTFYTKSGNQFYVMPKAVRDVATSINTVTGTVSGVTLFETNLFGVSYGKQCGLFSKAEAARYIGDECNDDLGAVQKGINGVAAPAERLAPASAEVTTVSYALVTGCRYTTNYAYRWIADHGQYLSKFRCAIGEEDSNRVQRALFEYYKRTH